MEKSLVKWDPGFEEIANISLLKAICCYLPQDATTHWEV